jgi:hypothetical protein
MSCKIFLRKEFEGKTAQKNVVLMQDVSLIDSMLL